MTVFALFLLLGLELKHFLADYAFQSEWMIRGKDSFAKPGGYAHVAVHAVGTSVVFGLFSVPVALAAGLVAAEAVVHYLLDFAKMRLGRGISDRENPRLFWSMIGFDQLLHHVTYIGLAYLVITLS